MVHPADCRFILAALHCLLMLTNYETKLDSYHDGNSFPVWNSLGALDGGWTQAEGDPMTATQYQLLVNQQTPSFKTGNEPGTMLAG